MTSKQYRYLGVQPFRSTHSHLFFGRDEDIENLYDLILLEKLIVLFGKSGYGKSSLLSAGVIPRLIDKNQPSIYRFRPIEIRFGNYIDGNSFSPLETVQFILEKEILVSTSTLRQNLSLWQLFKNLQKDTIDKETNRQFVLIFDQFEEFFSYPNEQQEAFRQQLAELLFNEVPQNIRDVIDFLDPAERHQLILPMNIKTVIAIRSDRMSLLDSMKDVLPNILHKRYELRPLTLHQAKEAIIRPALLGHDKEESWKEIFITPPFQYNLDALDAIFKFLVSTKNNQFDNSNGTSEGAEAFLLQIICEHVEVLVRDGKAPDLDNNGLPDVTLSQLPDMSNLLQGYYNRKIEELEPTHRLAAHLVLEDGLLFYDPITGDCRRMSVDGKSLLAQFLSRGLTHNLLDALEKIYLIRREPNTVGGFNYEISHDRLVEPAAKKRRERKMEEERLKAIERQKEAETRAQVEEIKRKEAEQARQEAENNVRKLEDLIGGITDLMESEKTAGIINFTPLKLELFKLLLPYHQYLSEKKSILEKPWQSARAHLHLGKSFESIGDTKFEKEFEIAFLEAVSAAELIKDMNQPIPTILYITLLDAAVFYAWNLMNRMEILEAENVLIKAMEITKDEQVNTTKLMYAQSMFQNALSRLMQEIKNEKQAFECQMKAVSLLRKAVLLDRDNLVFKSSLAVYLRNLYFVSDSLLSKEEKQKFMDEGFEIAIDVEDTPGSGTIVLSTIISCCYDKAWSLLGQQKYDEAIATMQNAKDRLNDGIHFEPSNQEYYLQRARINTSLADFEHNKNNIEEYRFYMSKAVIDWINVVDGKPILPSSLWMFKNIYVDIRRYALSIVDIDENIMLFKNITTAFEKTAMTYGMIPSMAFIAADSYAQLVEGVRKKEYDKELALTYLIKSIDFFDKARILEDLSKYEEHYQWYCRTYQFLLEIYCEKENLEQASIVFQQIKSLFDPILEKYPFDFYLRDSIRNSYKLFGEFLFKKNLFKTALPLLEFASKWGIRTSTEKLAQIYREGNLGKPDSHKAEELQKKAQGQTIKKFTIPCDFGGNKFPFQVYVYDYSKDAPYRGIDDQAEWLLQARGGVVPIEVRDSFKKLQNIAWENNVSFPELCMYAFDENNKNN